MYINDLDYSITELNLAINDHYDWAGKFLRLSLLGGEVDGDILDPNSAQHCRFSRWLSLRMNGEALDKEMVITIDKNHTHMHNVARELMQSIVHQYVTDSLLMKYQKAQQEFIHNLDQYKEHLFSWRNLHDALTGLPLRHLLYREFPLVRAQCQRMNHHLYLLIIDIDHFKSINDTWGHNAGDDVLRNVALALKEATRKAERIYRFGGEEFIILLDAKNDRDAQTAAQRIQQYLQQHSFLVGDDKITVTATGGLAKVLETDTLHQTIGRADKAMYYGKNTGRNRCIMAMTDSEMLTIS
ncbi:diguanylate cyclase [Buttiauxella sp. A2-C2_NF]|uniref:diguanylate cyclase n=1 Tax=Buttiauxella TaxID=82976 RepID=UPI001E59AF23|nr:MULTISPECIES: diguanylate cyclase [Buttiauxella]MCE0825809.1 diguanylate cyclase [Buttiauxella ferragutiae]